jgi:hypothetical protein
MIMLILLWVAIVSQGILAIGAIMDFKENGFGAFEFIIFIGVLITLPILYFIITTGTFTL